MKPFLEIDAPQRSKEWFAARSGRVTGSRAKDVLAAIKSGEAAARRDYRAQLVAERMTGATDEDGYCNADMQRGMDLEPLACAAYEARTGAMVQRSGFLAHRTLPIGCSLDGHVGDYEGLIEIKAPRPANHLTTLRAGVVPAQYLAQVTHNLYVTGAQWADFVSYCPQWPEPLHLFIVRVERDEAVIQRYADAVLAFLDEVELEVEAVRTLAGVGPVLQQAMEMAR